MEPTAPTHSARTGNSARTGSSDRSASSTSTTFINPTHPTTHEYDHG